MTLGRGLGKRFVSRGGTATTEVEAKPDLWAGALGDLGAYIDSARRPGG